MDHANVRTVAWSFGVAHDVDSSNGIAAILPAHGHDLLAGLSTLEVLDAALSHGERSAARPDRPALLAAVAPAPTAGCVAGCSPLRPSPGHGRVRRLDNRTQECAL